MSLQRKSWTAPFHECEFTDPSLIKILESFEIQVTKFHSNWNFSLLELVKCNFIIVELDENLNLDILASEKVCKIENLKSEFSQKWKFSYFSKHCLPLLQIYLCNIL